MQSAVSGTHSWFTGSHTFTRRCSCGDCCKGGFLRGAVCQPLFLSWYIPVVLDRSGDSFSVILRSCADMVVLSVLCTHANGRGVTVHWVSTMLGVSCMHVHNALSYRQLRFPPLPYRHLVVAWYWFFGSLSCTCHPTCLSFCPICLQRCFLFGCVE